MKRRQLLNQVLSCYQHDCEKHLAATSKLQLLADLDAHLTRTNWKALLADVTYTYTGILSRINEYVSQLTQNSFQVRTRRISTDTRMGRASTLIIESNCTFTGKHNKAMSLRLIIQQNMEEQYGLKGIEIIITNEGASVVGLKIKEDNTKFLRINGIGKLLNELPGKQVYRDHITPPIANIIEFTPLFYIGKHRLDEVLSLSQTDSIKCLTKSEKALLINGLKASNTIIGDKLNIIPMLHVDKFKYYVQQFNNFIHQTRQLASALGVEIEYNSLIVACMRTYESMDASNKAYRFDQFVMKKLDNNALLQVSWASINNTINSAYINSQKLEQKRNQEEKVNEKIIFPVSVHL